MTGTLGYWYLAVPAAHRREAVAQAMALLRRHRVRSDMAGDPRITTLVWCPSQEGHLRYAHHLAEAIDEGGFDPTTPGPADQVGILTTCPVPAQYRSVAYPMVCANRPVRPEAEFSNRLLWVLDRIGFHLRQETSLLRWMRRNRRYAGSCICRKSIF